MEEQQNWGEEYSEFGSVRADLEVSADYPNGEDYGFDI